MCLRACTFVGSPWLNQASLTVALMVAQEAEAAHTSLQAQTSMVQAQKHTAGFRVAAKEATIRARATASSTAGAVIDEVSVHFVSTCARK
jgi:hypothetical protein